MSTFDSVILEIAAELSSARASFPSWPHDPVHAAAVVAEECGEMQQACLQACYENGPQDAARKEAIQTAAMAIRFLLNFNRYNFKPAEQFTEIV